MKLLRRYIRVILEQECQAHLGGGVCGQIVYTGAEEREGLLGEPDLPGESEEQDVEAEASFGGVAGVSVPLGAGPTYPNKPKKKNKRA